MKIEDELLHLPHLENVGVALVQFVRELDPGGDFVQEGGGWLYRPNNFVEFTPRYKRTENITLTLRGGPAEFPDRPDLLLDSDWGVDADGRGGYSRCRIKSAKQLATAALYIETAYDNYKRGRNRTRQQPVTHMVKL